MLDSTDHRSPSPFADRRFRWMFASQIFSLLAIGILTMALSLAAYRIGGTAGAGIILGMILALKMVAYVFIAPIAEIWVSRFAPQKALAALDFLRMLLLVPMAFVDQTAAIAALAFLFFAISAAFTPLYQATIPLILDDEAAYARGLSLSRLAYTFESVTSPVLAGIALTIIAEHSLFLLAACSLLLSIASLLLSHLGIGATPSRKAPFLQRVSRGVGIELRTPRLRGLLALNLALSLGLGWVLVNSVVFAGARFGDDPRAFTTLMTGYGIGAASLALLVPRLLNHCSERCVMLIGCALFALSTPAILLPMGLAGFVLLWAVLGAASSMVMTPGGLVLNRSAARGDRPALFAAQFSLSHAAWLLAYPLAGWAGTVLGVEYALLALGTAAAVVTLVASRLWPADDPLERRHSHENLPPDHPHLRDLVPDGPGRSHVHAFHIDDQHPRWVM